MKALKRILKNNQHKPTEIKIMKKLIIALITLSVGFTASAQNSKVIGAWNGMNAYVQEQSDGPEQLVEAQKDIDEAITHETTGIQGKTWFYRGKIYYYLAKDANLSMDYPNALITSFESFEKAISIEDKKFKDGKEALTFVQNLSAEIFNQGLNYFNNGDYANAYTYFYKTKDVAALLEANGLSSAAKPIDAMNNAALAATNGKEYGKAIAIYEELLVEDPTNENAYARLSNLYKTDGNTEKAREVIAKGLEANPNSMILLTEDINFYLEDGKAVEAKEKILKAVEMDPENISLQMVKGDVHVQLLEWDDAIVAYEAAAALDDADFRPHFNMGIVYTKQADLMIEEMNNLGFSDEDKARYEELDAERTELFKKAYPHIQKAAELEPDNDAVQRALTQVEAKMK